MKYYELDAEEKNLLKSYEQGEFLSVKKVKAQRTKYQKYSQLTLSKTRNINIRIPEKDLLKIKALAAEQGIPYQTLLSSLIHRYSAAKVLK